MRRCRQQSACRQLPLTEAEVMLPLVVRVTERGSSVGAGEGQRVPSVVPALSAPERLPVIPIVPIEVPAEASRRDSR